MKKFQQIRAQAEKRKGGPKIMGSLLTAPMKPVKLAEIGDDRFLAQITRCVFNAGFHWRVITQKWPGFEDAFHAFDLGQLLTKSPDQWEKYIEDERIVRNWQKIQTVFVNAGMIADVSEKHGSFGQFFADWPVSDQIGLLQFLKKNGARLGGQTAQYFIRFMGKDSFITSSDVITALRANGVQIAEKPTSQRDMRRIQDAFNHWHDETGLPYSHISRILSFTVGDNIPAEVLKEYRGSAVTH